MEIVSSNLVPMFLVISYLSLFNSVDAVNEQFQICRVPSHCGDQEIKFPFYIQGDQEQFCGYPGFEISCINNGKPIINLSGEEYIIHNIFYQNHSLSLSNAAFSSYDNNNNNTTTCFPSVKNLTLPGDHFTLTSNQSRVFLLYDCLSSTPSMTQNLSCSEEIHTSSVQSHTSSVQSHTNSVQNHTEKVTNCSVVFPASTTQNLGCSVLAFPEKNFPESQVVGKARNCGVVVEYPVQDWALQVENVDIGEVLELGFLLNWTTSDCGNCERTGGTCGFDYSSYNFQCYCRDRPHGFRCDPHGKGSWVNVAIGVTCGGIGILLLLLLLCFILRKNSPSHRLFFFRKLKNPADKSIEAFLRDCEPLQARRYSYSQVKKITTLFKQKLGQGGFGSVYKGALADGSLVAVKMLSESKANGEDFINEVATISRTSHVNIVSLLGFCFEGPKKALVYEFMPNGSLEKFIFSDDAPGNSPQLDWDMYYRISLGIARGLEYLHRGCNTRILHFDIKPHNILLDADFVPKIADFGLAKICATKESLVSMECPRGTIGYIAPEVFSRNFGGVSHKSDVYSYGMMILQMVGGRENINVKAKNTSEIYFPHWIYKRLELREELELKRVVGEKDRAKVRKMIITSLWCIQTNPSSRPAMSKVIEMLEGSLDSLQVPPMPFLSSPSRSPPLESSINFE